MEGDLTYLRKVRGGGGGGELVLVLESFGVCVVCALVKGLYKIGRAHV